MTRHPLVDRKSTRLKSSHLCISSAAPVPSPFLLHYPLPIFFWGCPFATGCHRLQPRGSIRAPSSVVSIRHIAGEERIDHVPLRSTRGTDIRSAAVSTGDDTPPSRRSEEHTSEIQSLMHLVRRSCSLALSPTLPSSDLFLGLSFCDRLPSVATPGLPKGSILCCLYSPHCG